MDETFDACVGGSGLLAMVVAYGIGRHAYGLFVPTFMSVFGLSLDVPGFYDQRRTGREKNTKAHHESPDTEEVVVLRWTCERSGTVGHGATVRQYAVLRGSPSY